MSQTFEIKNQSYLRREIAFTPAVKGAYLLVAIFYQPNSPREQ